MCCWRRRTSEGRKESAALCFADLGAAAASRLLCCTQTTAGVVETEMMMCLWVSVDSGCRHGLLKKSMIFKLLFVSVWLFLFFTDFPWPLGHFGSSQCEKTPCLCTLFSWTAVWMDLKMIKELHSVFVYISHSIPPLCESGLSPILGKKHRFSPEFGPEASKHLSFSCCLKKTDELTLIKQLRWWSQVRIWVQQKTEK